LETPVSQLRVRSSAALFGRLVARSRLWFCGSASWRSLVPLGRWSTAIRCRQKQKCQSFATLWSLWSRSANRENFNR